MKLNKYANNITSQNGENGIIEYILNNLPRDINKVCIEFGAWDGKHLSNTYPLWHDQGWKGILIEADTERCNKLVKTYSDYAVSVYNQFVTPTEGGSLDELFKNNQLQPEVGLLSIDIDSTDYHVWKNMEYVRPAIVIIEHNQAIPAYIEYHDPEGEVFLRCSAKDLEKLGREKGYKLVCCTVSNSIFVRDDFFNSSKFPDMPVEYLFDYSHCTPPHLKVTLDKHKSCYIPMFYGKPTKIQKYIYPIVYRLLAMVKGGGYTRPGKAILDECKKRGIYGP